MCIHFFIVLAIHKLHEDPFSCSLQRSNTLMSKLDWFLPWNSPWILLQESKSVHCRQPKIIMITVLKLINKGSSSLKCTSKWASCIPCTTCIDPRSSKTLTSVSTSSRKLRASPIASITLYAWLLKASSSSRFSAGTSRNFGKSAMACGAISKILSYWTKMDGIMQ